MTLITLKAFSCTEWSGGLSTLTNVPRLAAPARPPAPPCPAASLQQLTLKQRMCRNQKDPDLAAGKLAGLLLVLVLSCPKPLTNPTRDQPASTTQAWKTRIQRRGDRQSVTRPAVTMGYREPRQKAQRGARET